MKMFFPIILVLLFFSVQLNCGTISKYQKIYVDYDRELGVIYFEGRVFLDTEAPGSSDDMEMAYSNPRFLKETTAFTEGKEIINSEASSEGGSSEGSGENERRYKPGEYEFYYCLVVAVLLTLGAGIMSGLTVGYLSIDQLELELKLKNGTDEEKKEALAVFPVLEDHHYLLVTLLLANAL
jgi:general stress protein CsbA